MENTRTHKKQNYFSFVYHRHVINCTFYSIILYSYFYILLKQVVEFLFCHFDNSYLCNKITYLAHTWQYTQGTSTTDVVKSLFKYDQNVFIYLPLSNLSIAHDSVTTQSLDLI